MIFVDYRSAQFFRISERILPVRHLYSLIIYPVRKMSVGTEKRPPFSAPKQAESPPPAGGSFGAKISGKNANGCICDRPKALILCQSCGFKLAAGKSPT